MSDELKKIISDQIEKSLCIIICDQVTRGTGFLCLIPFPDKRNLLSVLVTNRYVLEDNDIALNKKINIILQNNKKPYKIIIDKDRKIYRSNKYDITFVEIKHNELDINLFLEIDEPERKNSIKDIYLLYHNEEWKSDFYVDEIRNIGSDKYTIEHNFNTGIRHPGGAIINKINQKVIAVDRGFKKGKYSYFGTLIFDPIKDFFNQEKQKKQNNLEEEEEEEEKEEEDDINEDDFYQNFDKIKIIYKIPLEETIRLFGDKFVENNKNVCKIIIDGQENELCSVYNTRNIKFNEEKFFEIKLKGIANINNINYMFSNCKSLVSLPDIEKLNTSKFTEMCGIFEGCISLKKFSGISKWKTDNAININCMFYKCESLKSLPDISEWKIDKVNNMHSIFCLCKSLESLPDISKWNTRNVTNMNSLFYGCESLSHLPDISEWKTKKVTNMGNIFEGCRSLINLPDINKWNTSKVTNISCMFNGCLSLKSLPDISKWDTSNVNNSYCLFGFCKSLSRLPDISVWNTQKVIHFSCIFM